MKYDIASKVLLEHCKSSVLRHFCGLDVEESEIIEDTPQETATLRRADYVLRARIAGLGNCLVVIEFASRWESKVPLRVLEYRCRHLIKESLPVISTVILLMPSGSALDYYRDSEVQFHFNLVRIYELDAREYLELPECLLGFVPLMKNGTEFTEEAERRIYESRLPRSTRADILTGMAILGGLKDRDLSSMLIAKRRDIMMESHAYEIIMNEGFEKGMQQGMQQGMLQDAREMVLDALEAKFGETSACFKPQVAKITDRNKLKEILKIILKVQDIKELESSHIWN